jgi:hypothetical protein
MISKTKQNKQKEQQASDEEDYQTGQQERFTDEYNEYFEDDENEADRFTDDYQEDFKSICMKQGQSNRFNDVVTLWLCGLYCCYYHTITSTFSLPVPLGLLRR